MRLFCRALCLGLLLVWTAAASAATNFAVPDVQITGAEQPIPLGELVDLFVSSPKTTPQYLVSTSYDWKVLDGDQEKHVRNYGNGVFFGAGVQAKKVKAIVAVTYLYVVMDGDKLKEAATRTVFLSATVQIGDPTPPPSPPSPPTPPTPPSPPTPPTPPAPTPDPTFPDGQFKLSAFAYKTAMLRLSSVPKDQLPRATKALATAFRGISSAIAAGTLSDPRDILTKTHAATVAALGQAGFADTTALQPFSKDLGDQVYSLYKSGGLKTAADYGVAWNEIALGLESIK